MFKVEIIGNLGADAVVKSTNGSEFLTFRVAHTNKFTNKSTGEIREETIWASCVINGRQESVLPYLKTGTKVYVRGNGSLQIYSSPKTRQMECGLSISVHELELCGGMRPEDRALLETAKQWEQMLVDKGYQDWAEIPTKKKK